MNIRHAIEQDQEQWNQFVYASPYGSFLQSWEWGHMQQLLGTPYWRLILEEDGSIHAVALVIKRELPLGFSWLYVPRGPIFAKTSAGKAHVFEALQARLMELGKEGHASFVRIDPGFTDTETHPFPPLSGRAPGVPPDKGDAGGFAWRKAEREVQPRHTQILDLSPSEEELLAAMHPKTRYNIGLAQRKGVRVHFSTSLHDVDAFLRLSKEVSSRSGFHYHPDNYYRALVAALAPANTAELAVAEYKEQVLAAHLMVYGGQAATYTHGASSHAQRSLMAPILTYWETIKRAKEKGMKSYDFFGIAPPDSGKDHPWAGITRVKQGFGGRPVSYVGAYDMVISENSYGMLNAARRLRSLLR